MIDIQEIINKLGITPNRMQQEVYESFKRSGTNNLIILSPTGTGKTLAYLLPIVQQLDVTSNEVQCIVVVPGRELALQSSKVVSQMGAGIRACACYGGRPTMDEHRVLRQKQPVIVFGTPGRLNDHITKGNILTEHVRFIVLDEYDKCLEMGFRDEMKELLSRLPHVAHHVLLSATRCQDFDTQASLADYKQLDYLPKEGGISSRIKLYQVNSPEKDKLDSLVRLLLHVGNQSSIVFLNYRESVERTANYLRSLGFKPAVYHGGLEQPVREEAIYKIMNGSSNILVSTDLGSRGLDIPDVENIINYHIPETYEAFVHRVGRTGRWQAEGKAFMILGPEETMPEYANVEINRFEFPEGLQAENFKIEDFEIPLPKMSTLYIGKGKKSKISKGDVLGFLCKQCGLVTNEIGRIDVYDYYSLVAVQAQVVEKVLKMAVGQKIKGVKTVVEKK